MTERRFYRRPWRIDITVRDGVPRLLPAAELARIAAAGLDAATAPDTAIALDDAAPRGSSAVPAASATFPAASVGLILTDDRELAELNEQHMGTPGPTDVLSFPLLPPAAFPPHEGRGSRPVGGPGGGTADATTGQADSEFALPPGVRLHLGDIVVSVERAVAQAEAGRGGWTGDVRWSPADELRLLVVHGTLHVCGWDHAEPEERTGMRRLEARVLGKEPPR